MYCIQLQNNKTTCIYVYMHVCSKVSKTSTAYVDCSIVRSICIHCSKLQYMQHRSLHYSAALALCYHTQLNYHTLLHAQLTCACVYLTYMSYKDTRTFSSPVGWLIHTLISMLSLVVVSSILWNHGWLVLVQQLVSRTPHCSPSHRTSSE